MKAGPSERRPGNPQKGEPSCFAMRQAITAGPAILVRGSSRRIHDHVGGTEVPIHEYQSDQLSATNLSAFARFALPCMKLRKKKRNQLTGSLHISEALGASKATSGGRLRVHGA